MPEAVAVGLLGGTPLSKNNPTRHRYVSGMEQSTAGLEQNSCLDALFAMCASLCLSPGCASTGTTTALIVPTIEKVILAGIGTHERTFGILLIH
ncbi:hypothetical protein KL86DPRO_20267 [uncultured delta proteobacterium]|uniref:Uncharacterized protein n=1 Tax=uncultured delta proteobacterium TaxID=34034 RepID=A0A212JXR5_9DELT|nr:hypothetical protein KL86DPRO_20267 [uncultured delta proteobacterium]